MLVMLGLNPIAWRRSTAAARGARQESGQAQRRRRAPGVGATMPRGPAGPAAGAVRRRAQHRRRVDERAGLHRAAGRISTTCSARRCTAPAGCSARAGEGNSATGGFAELERPLRLAAADMSGNDFQGRIARARRRTGSTPRSTSRQSGQIGPAPPRPGRQAGALHQGRALRFGQAARCRRSRRASISWSIRSAGRWSTSAAGPGSSTSGGCRAATFGRRALMSDVRPMSAWRHRHARRRRRAGARARAVHAGGAGRLRAAAELVGAVPRGAAEALRSTPLYDETSSARAMRRSSTRSGCRRRENPGYFGALDAAGEARFGERRLAVAPRDRARRGEPGAVQRQYLADRAIQEQPDRRQIRARRAKDKNFLPGVPDTVEGLHQYFEQQQAAKRAAGAAVWRAARPSAGSPPASPPAASKARSTIRRSCRRW
jgi:hypothetical protein